MPIGTLNKFTISNLCIASKYPLEIEFNKTNGIPIEIYLIRIFNFSTPRPALKSDWKKNDEMIIINEKKIPTINNMDNPEIKIFQTQIWWNL